MKAAQGIEVHGNKLRTVFYYKKVKCSESLDLENTPKNVQIAIKKRADVLSDIRRGKFNYLEHFPNSKKALLFDLKPKSYLIKDLLEEQIRFYESSKKYAENTVRDYVRYIKNELIPAFGKYQINELTPIIIRDWIACSKQSSKYVSNLLIPLTATLNDAKNLGIISENPIDKLSLKRLFQCFDDDSDYEINPFKPQERKLISINSVGEVRNLVQFCFYSGLRIGEVLALKWDKVNLDERKIKVEFTMVRGKLSKPKTKNSIRELVLLDKAYDAIQEQLKYKKYDNDFVFHNPNTGNNFISTDSFRKHWVRIFDSINIKYRNPYQMRHTFASMLLSNGENALKVAKYLGHKDTEMVTKIYGKYIPKNESDVNCFKGAYDNE